MGSADGSGEGVRRKEHRCCRRRIHEEVPTLAVKGVGLDHRPQQAVESAACTIAGSISNYHCHIDVRCSCAPVNAPRPMLVTTQQPQTRGSGWSNEDRDGTWQHCRGPRWCGISARGSRVPASFGCVGSLNAAPDRARRQVAQGMSSAKNLRTREAHGALRATSPCYRFCYCMVRHWMLGRLVEE